ncbi:MAG: hypothetical protein KC636_16885 [Myxococcales bacterium]|nr:hypothetical protein [Myxococcales bacterium]
MRFSELQGQLRESDPRLYEALRHMMKAGTITRSKSGRSVLYATPSDT